MRKQVAGPGGAGAGMASAGTGSAGNIQGPLHLSGYLGGGRKRKRKRIHKLFTLHKGWSDAMDRQVVRDQRRADYERMQQEKEYMRADRAATQQAKNRHYLRAARFQKDMETRRNHKPTQG